MRRPATKTSSPESSATVGKPLSRGEVLRLPAGVDLEAVAQLEQVLGLGLLEADIVGEDDLDARRAPARG